MKRAGLVLVAIFGALGLLLFGSTGQGGSGVVAQAAGCGAPLPDTGTSGGDPSTGVAGLDAEQIAIATTAIGVGKARGVPPYGWVVILAAGSQESHLRNLLGGDADSLGWLQQRPSQGWGTAAQITDPAFAAGSFYTHLLAVPGWEQMPVTAAAQAVQRSGFPLAYADDEPLARQLVEQIGGQAPPVVDPTGGGAPAADACPTGGPLTGDGGQAPQGCTVIPDPSTGRGCLTPRTLALYTQLVAQGYTGISCWDPHPQNPQSDHPLGRACDVPANGHAFGVLPSPADKARMDALNATLQASAAAIGLNYTIWYGTYYPVGRPSRPYSGGGHYDPASITGGHFDHVHISLF